MTFPTFARWGRQAPVSGGASKAFSYQTSTVNLTSGSSFTFSGVSIGAASSDRLVAVLVFGQGSTTTVSSATIGGVSATIVAQQQSTDFTASIVSAIVPSGTTVDIVIHWGASQSACGIGVYTTPGVTSSSAYDAQTTDVYNSAANVSTQSGGVLVAASFLDDHASTFTWTGITADFNILNVHNRGASGGHTNGTSSGTTSINNTYGNWGGSGAAHIATVAASW